MKFIEIWVTCPSNDVAERLADALVEARLVACANIFGQVRSVYRWQDKVERAAEVALLLKARDADYDELAEKITALHPYDTPAIVAVPVARCNASYSDWLIDATERPPA